MNQTLQYKGYDGSVEYSAEDRLLHGQILGIRDMVIYDAVDVDSLEKNFQGAVDEYLEFCRVEGRLPNKPFKGSLNIRISHDLHRKASTLAEQRKRKLNAIINDALEVYVAKAS
jgi:predicted HicB family RNase H-like nuclease